MAAASRLPQKFGPYVLQELIARGGMAEIYRATTQGVGGFEKTVAIKKILPHLAENDEFITMLIDEARIIVNLSHANIAQVYDLGKLADDYYIAMEYVHGTDLSTIVKALKDSGRTMPVEHALFITAGIAAGLHVAHAKCDANGLPQYIVHRDVSPHNILISFAGDVKIIDFGVAKARGKEAHTQVGVIKGKLLYMAPEQAMGKVLDGRADLFAMGLILYRMLTNHLPFEGENEFQIYNNILSKEITPPRVYNPTIPEEVNQIAMMMLQRDPSKRYQDGYSAKVDLDRALQRVAPGYSMSRLSRWVETEFSQLIAERKLAAGKSGQHDRPQTPSFAHVTDAGFQPAGWDDYDDVGEDTLNVSMNSPEAQAMIDRVRAERAAAVANAADVPSIWGQDDATNETPNLWSSLQQPTAEQQPARRPPPPLPPNPRDSQAAPAVQPNLQMSEQPPQPQQPQAPPSWGAPAGSGMFPEPDPYQPYGQQAQQHDPYQGAPAGSGMFPAPQQPAPYDPYGYPNGSGMHSYGQRPAYDQELAGSGMHSYGQRPGYQQEPAGSGMYPAPQQPGPMGSGMHPSPQYPGGTGMFANDPNMYGGAPAGSGIFGAPPPNASGANPAYYGPSRQSGAFGALGTLPPQPGQPYEAYQPQGAPPAAAKPGISKQLMVPLFGAVVLILAIIVMVLINALASDPEPAQDDAVVVIDDEFGEVEQEQEAVDLVAVPEEPAEEPTPAVVMFSASTAPAGATVFLNDEELGTTPLEVEVAQGEDQVALRFELEGYETAQVSVIPVNDFKRSMELKPIKVEPEPEVAPKPKPKADPEPKPKAEPQKSTPKKAAPKKSTPKKSAPKIPFLDEPAKKPSDDIPLF